jgi:sugar O-acyltransferase (sialic acid O-acetyltransferase NeuD family)
MLAFFVKLHIRGIATLGLDNYREDMMSRMKVYLIGATSAGRELESIIDTIDYERWELIGFLHSYAGESPLCDKPSDYRILGSWDSYPLKRNDNCILAIPDIVWKKRAYNFLRDRAKIVTYVSPLSRIGKFSQVGEGSILVSTAVLSCNVHIGKMVYINGGTQIGHDTIVGDYSTIFSQVQIGGKCVIGEGVTIGSCAVLRPGVKIGDGATIGTGSVVIRNVKPGVTVFGNPAKTISMSE